MQMRRIRGLALVIAASFLWDVHGAIAESPLFLKKGDPAPDFELSRVDGGTIRLSALRGKVVVLYFWGTWCPPCLKQMTTLQTLYASLDRSDLEILAIAVPRKGEQGMKPILPKVSVRYPMLYDTSYPDIASRLYRCDEGSAPNIFVIDRKGRVLDEYHRYDHDFSLPATITDFKQLVRRSALHFAARSANRKLVARLLDEGEGVNQVDDWDITPLYLAAKEGHQDVVALLLERGAAVNQADDRGMTPLYVAVKEGHRGVVALLLERGAAVNQADKDGKTSLHQAAYSGQREMVELLLTYGADKRVQMTLPSSGTQLRPVDFARVKRHEALIPLLEP